MHLYTLFMCSVFIQLHMSGETALNLRCFARHHMTGLKTLHIAAPLIAMQVGAKGAVSLMLVMSFRNPSAGDSRSAYGKAQ